MSLHVLDIKEIRQLSVGNGSYYPKRGFKFFQMLLEAKNNSDKEAKLSWNEVFVLDTVSRTRYSPQFIMNNSTFNIGGRAQRPIKPSEKVSKRLIYSIPFDVKTEFFGLNGTIQRIPHVEVIKR